jgi:H+/Cl- antiporter ClcA
MTGGFGLVLPTLWVSVLAFLFSDRQSLFHSQVERRVHSPAPEGSEIQAGTWQWS